MGMRYAEGDGVIQNDKEAARWFALNAKQELAEAQYQYGLVLLQGRVVVQDYKSGFSWIEKPAQRSHAKAQYRLGEPYRYGTPAPRSTSRAPTCGSTSRWRRAWTLRPRRATVWCGN